MMGVTGPGRVADCRFGSYAMLFAFVHEPEERCEFSEVTGECGRRRSRGKRRCRMITVQSQGQRGNDQGDWSGALAEDAEATLDDGTALRRDDLPPVRASPMGFRHPRKGPRARTQPHDADHGQGQSCRIMAAASGAAACGLGGLLDRFRGHHGPDFARVLGAMLGAFILFATAAARACFARTLRKPWCQRANGYWELTLGIGLGGS